MTLDQVPSGARILVDANILVYHFQPHPTFGPVCHRFMERIERRDIEGLTFTNLLAEVAHRLMLIEAGNLPGWSGPKTLNRLKRQPSVIRQMTLFQSAIDSILQSNVIVFPVAGPVVSTAAALSRQHHLLTNDALIVAMMQQHAIILVASNDGDLDRVPGITRFSPA